MVDAACQEGTYSTPLACLNEALPVLALPPCCPPPACPPPPARSMLQAAPKADVLKYLDHDGPKPARKARAMLVMGNADVSKQL